MKICRLALAFILLVSLLVPGAEASEDESGNYIYVSMENGKLRFSKHSDYVTLLEIYPGIEHLVIPAYVEGLPVKEIYLERGYSATEDVTDITIPETVKNIDSPRYSACPKITRIDVSAKNTKFSSVDGVLFNKAGTSLISYPGGRLGEYAVPDGVTEIKSNAFSRCKNLTGVSLPDTLTEIQGSAFSECENLTGVVLPDTLKTLSGAAFYKCTALKEMTIPDSVTRINESTFNGCTALETVVLSDSVTSIGNFAFSGCSSLRHIKIPGNVTFIGTNPFRECANLASMELAEENKSFVCQGGALFGFSTALSGAKKLKLISCPAANGSYTVPDGVAGVNSYAFSGCTNLVSVTLGKDVTDIGRDAFSGCASLKEITIPRGFTSVGQGAFLSCDALSDVYYEGSQTDWDAVKIGIANTSLQNAVIHYGSQDAGSQTASVANVTVSTDGISADIWCGQDAASAFCVCYNDKGQMVGTDSCVLTTGDNHANFAVDAPFSDVTIIVLDSQYKPLCVGS